MAKKENLREMSDVELLGRLDEAKDDIFTTRVKSLTSGEDPSQAAVFIRTSRRAVARVLTELRRRELEAFKSGAPAPKLDLKRKSQKPIISIQEPQPVEVDEPKEPEELEELPDLEELEPDPKESEPEDLKSEPEPAAPNEPIIEIVHEPAAKESSKASPKKSAAKKTKAAKTPQTAKAKKADKPAKSKKTSETKAAKTSKPAKPKKAVKAEKE